MSIGSPAEADYMDEQHGTWRAPSTARSALSAVGLAWLIAGAAIIGTVGFVAGRLTAPTVDKAVSGTVVTTVASSSSKKPAPAGTPTLDQALALHTAGKLDEAVTAYRAIAAADPKNKFAPYNLGQIAQQRNDVAEASAQYTAALDIDAKYVPALYNLSLIKAAAGDSAGAIALLRTAVEADPTNANALFNLGKLLVASGDAAGGADFIGKAVAIDPSLKP